MGARTFAATSFDIERCLTALGQLTRDVSRNNSVFRIKESISTSADEIYVGLSTGFKTKGDMINKLCKTLNIKPDTIRWYCNEDLIFSSR